MWFFQLPKADKLLASQLGRTKSELLEAQYHAEAWAHQVALLRERAARLELASRRQRADSDESEGAFLLGGQS